MESILGMTLGLLVLFIPYFVTAVAVWVVDKTISVLFNGEEFEIAASGTAHVVLLAFWSFIFGVEMLYYFYLVGAPATQELKALIL